MGADSAVQDQIDDTVREALLRARTVMPADHSAEWCDDCGELIPERRRTARVRT
jgi:RNA polymerase-binding transcription factor DksA